MEDEPPIALDAKVPEAVWEFLKYVNALTEKLTGAEELSDAIEKGKKPKDRAKRSDRA